MSSRRRSDAPSKFPENHAQIGARASALGLLWLSVRMAPQSVGLRVLRLSVPAQLTTILVLYGLILAVVCVVGESAVSVYRHLGASFDPAARSDDLLWRYSTAPTPEGFRRYLESLAAHTGEAGRAQLAVAEPNFAAVHASVRERDLPLWLRGARRAVSVVMPGDVFASADRLEAEGIELLDQLAAVTATLNRDRSTRSRSAEVQRPLAELRDFARKLSAENEHAVTRIRRWQRDVAFATTLLALVLAVLVGFIGATAIRRAAAHLSAHVSDVEQGKVRWRLSSAPGDDLAPVVAAFNEMAATVETAARKAEEDARQAGKALRDLHNIMETIPDVICILDLLGRLDLWNHNLQRATGLAESALTRRPMRDLFSEEDRAAIDAAVHEGIRKGRFEVEGRLLGPDGQARPYHWTGAVLEDVRGGLIGVTVSGRDIAERKALEQQLVHQAFHDPLTSLPNRALFMNRISHALARTTRGTEAVGVLFLDLDRFKVINDSLGHHAGDRLLAEVSGRLRECVRPGDTVARLGGDEFAVLLEDIEGVNEATQVAERIAVALDAAFICEGREVFVTTSVGIAFSHAGLTSPEELVRDADIAMYHAKSKGKARYEIFDDRAQASAIDRLDLEIDLRAAMSKQEFRLHYQPVVDLATGRIVEIEALIRWEHRDRGLLPPSDFITLSEETGLIVPIGMWVLEEACRQVHAWQSAYETDPPLVLSVNLSARQFQQPSLVSDIAWLLQQTGLRPDCLKLEITESVVMHDAPATLARLYALKELGVKLAIDDFGTGYSSLSYLKRFPIDVLKIDQGFVRGLGGDADDTAIVRAIITVAKNLNLSVTAEGIETAEQVTLLRELGCDRGQGYYFARPLAADPLASLFAHRLPDSDASPMRALARIDKGPSPAAPARTGREVDPPGKPSPRGPGDRSRLSRLTS
jgi:diguanylate cyclase (GGDEF)-like protein/PAS domain S-box-containing protein